MRRLQQHVAGRIRDRRAPPAHDAGEADRAARIGDHQILGIELVFLVIQESEPLLGCSRSHPDAPAQPP